MFITSQDEYILQPPDTVERRSEKGQLLNYFYVSSSKSRVDVQPLSEFQESLVNDKAMMPSSESEDELNNGKINIEELLLPFDKYQPELHKKILRRHRMTRLNTQNAHDMVIRRSGTVTVPVREIYFQTKESTFKQFCEYLKQKYDALDITFDPDGVFRLCWDVYCMFLIFYEITSIPFEISFNYQFSEQWQIMVDISFAIDILLNFNTGFHKGGLLIKSRDRIIFNYLKAWFWIDVAGSFPYSRLIEWQVSQDAEIEQPTASQKAKQAQHRALLRLFSFTKLIRIIRLLRLAKLKVLMNKFEEFLHFSTIVAAIIQFLKLCFFVLFWSHWLACVFHFVAQQEKLQDTPSWLDLKGLQNDSISQRYIHSLYWAVVTMNTVGYGDISPQTYTERLLGIVFLLIACGVFSFTMNTIGSALQSVEVKRSSTSKQMNEVSNWLEKKKVSKSLQTRIKKYLSFVMSREKDDSLNLDQICASLCDSLRDQLIVQINGSILAYCPLLCSNYNRKFLIKLSYFFKEVTLNPEEVLFTESSREDRNLYFVQDGIIQLYLEKNQQKIQEIQKGDYFGIQSFITGLSRMASARSRYFSDLFYLRRDDFLACIRNFPKEYEKFMHLQYNIIHLKEYYKMDIYCYSCNQGDHMLMNCPSLHFIVDIPIILQTKKRYSQMLRKQFIRAEMVSFHALKHMNIYNEPGQQLQKLALDIFDQENEWNLQEQIETDSQEERKFEKLIEPRDSDFKFQEERKLKKEQYLQLKTTKDKLFLIEHNERLTLTLIEKLRRVVTEDHHSLKQLSHLSNKQYRDQKRQERKKRIKRLTLMRDFTIDMHENQEDLTDTDLVVEAKLTSAIKHYKRQKDFLVKKNNHHAKRRVVKNIGPINNFEVMNDFEIFNPQSNADIVIREYNKVMLRKLNLRPDDEIEYEDLVFEEFVDYYQLQLEEADLISKLPDKKLRLNLTSNQKSFMGLCRQEKKKYMVQKLPQVRLRVPTQQLQVLGYLQSSLQFDD